MRDAKDIAKDEAFNWCLRNHIRIYPVAHPSETYTASVMSNGKKRRVSLPLMKICIEIDNNKQYGKAFYKQDNELYDKINELLTYYYTR